MATPRIFVSSTCYDLQEIRFQLRHFIQEFGYDPVMSEFDDIFYNYELHVQDSCLEEISKCQLFILVIGNNYGSIYHKDREGVSLPDSVTLQEFRKAIETDIFKHIFTNKFVDYDYKNYKRALEKVFLKEFKDKDVPSDKIEKKKLAIKKTFDETYPFPYESYKYVFYFLDIISELRDGNAISTFESFGDIKESLKKQWAGFMYESISKKDKKLEATIKPIEERLNSLDSSIKKLLEVKTSNNEKQISFDISKITQEKSIEALQQTQNNIDNLLNSIFCYPDKNLLGDIVGWKKKVWFSKYFDQKLTKEWLESLKKLVNDYKWSKRLSVNDIFFGFHCSTFLTRFEEVEYSKIFELNSIYEALEDKDKITFVNTAMQRFKNAYEAPKDDLPF